MHGIEPQLSRSACRRSRHLHVQCELCVVDMNGFTENSCTVLRNHRLIGQYRRQRETSEKEYFSEFRNAVFNLAAGTKT